MEKSIMTISRKWHNPEVRVTVTKEEIALEMPLDDFIHALIQEIGPITWVFTAEAFRLLVLTAAKRVVRGVKEESAKVV